MTMTRRAKVAWFTLGALLAIPALWIRITGDLPAFRFTRR